MKFDNNNLYGLALSQKMPDGNFEWLREDESCDMGLLLNYADGRIAIFDTGLYDYHKKEKDKKSFILEVN